RDAVVVVGQHTFRVLAVPELEHFSDRAQIALLDRTQLTSDVRIERRHCLAPLRPSSLDSAKPPTRAVPSNGAACLPLTAAHRKARPGADSVTFNGGMRPIWRRIMALSK